MPFDAVFEIFAIKVCINFHTKFDHLQTFGKKSCLSFILRTDFLSNERKHYVEDAKRTKLR